jgi:hypothetical protein
MALLSDRIAERLIELGAAEVRKLYVEDRGPGAASQAARAEFLDALGGQYDGTVFGLGN